MYGALGSTVQVMLFVHVPSMSQPYRRTCVLQDHTLSVNEDVAVLLRSALDHFKTGVPNPIPIQHVSPGNLGIGFQSATAVVVWEQNVRTKGPEITCYIIHGRRFGALRTPLFSA